MNKIARLITLEGSEGAGKTTALNVICKILDSWNIKYICTREPGGEPTSERIRDILLHSEHLHAKTELLLMFAARNEHIQNIVKPALTKGIWVVSDRYVDASYAYQGGGRELGFDVVKWLDEFIVAKTQADFTLLMDIEPGIGLKRIKVRGKEDRIEQESIEFFNRITAAYRQKAQLESHRYAVIDASHPIELVEQAIKEAFLQRKETLL
jgi:dTMP kinase